MPLPPFQGELSVRPEEIRRIAAENTLVLEDILGLMRELDVVEDRIHVLTKQTIPGHCADNEREYRDIIQGGLKLEEEIHALEPIKEEVLRLSSEKMDLEALCKQLSLKVQSLYRELEHVQSDNRQMTGVREELHDLQEEILRTRIAYEFEKRAKVELLEQSQATERDFMNMKMEAHRLQAEMENMRPGVFRHHAFGSYYNR